MEFFEACVEGRCQVLSFVVGGGSAFLPPEKKPSSFRSFRWSLIQFRSFKGKMFVQKCAFITRYWPAAFINNEMRVSASTTWTNPKPVDPAMGPMGTTSEKQLSSTDDVSNLVTSLNGGSCDSMLSMTANPWYAYAADMWNDTSWKSKRDVMAS